MHIITSALEVGLAATMHPIQQGTPAHQLAHRCSTHSRRLGAASRAPRSSCTRSKMHTDSAWLVREGLAIQTSSPSRMSRTCQGSLKHDHAMQSTWPCTVLYNAGWLLSSTTAQGGLAA